MKPFGRSAILLIALLAVIGAGFQLFGTSGGKAPSGDPHKEHEHSEGAVALSDAKVAEAGIELAKAGPGTLRDSLILNGVLQPNHEALVQVTPRFAGVVRDLNKRVGDRVEKSELLGKIESNQSLTVYELKAPIAGTIIDRQAALGEFASEQKPTFVIADLSTVWVDFAVYRRDMNRVRIGDLVVIDPEDGGAKIEARISYVSPIGSADTQSALVRAVVANPEQRLRPGLFVTGRVMLTQKPVGVAIKSSALQTHENRTVVFVRSGDKFEVREVEVGDRDQDNVEVLFGIAEGDMYAAKNSFVIKAELGKGAATHEH